MCTPLLDQHLQHMVGVNEMNYLKSILLIERRKKIEIQAGPHIRSVAVETLQLTWYFSTLSTCLQEIQLGIESCLWIITSAPNVRELQ